MPSSGASRALAARSASSRYFTQTASSEPIGSNNQQTTSDQFSSNKKFKASDEERKKRNSTTKYSAKLKKLESEIFGFDLFDSSDEDVDNLEVNQSGDVLALESSGKGDEKIELTKGFHKKMFNKLGSIDVSEYENKLRKDYEIQNMSSSWSIKAAISHETSTSSHLSKANDAQSTTITRKKRMHTINYKKLKNLNFSHQHTLKVTAIDFFKQSDISLTASLDQRLTLFKADDDTNELLHSLFMKKYPILSAHFQCNEEKIVFNSLFRNFCQFDLTKERTNFTKLDKKDKSCKIKFSKLSKNDSLALVNNDASVDIYCLKSLTKISHFASSHSISDVIFDNSSQSLISVSDETDRINIWDIRNQKIRSQLIDVTSHSNTSLGLSPKEKLLCVGNSKGPISAYSLKEGINLLETGTMAPTKVFSNLKTVCNGLRFSNKTNLMVSYSSNANNSIKLINCSAKLVYSNFLVNEESRCSAATFSPNGTVLYLGMTTGAVRPYSFTDLQ